MAEGGTIAVYFGKQRQIVRECVAVTLWAYVLLKLFVVDPDVYILRLAPGLSRVLDLRVFALMGVLCAGCLVLGQKRFLKLLLYLLAYPVVVLFWKLPLTAFKRWPLIIAFAPVIYRAVSSFPATFLTYTIAALSGLAIVASSQRALLLLSMAGFAVLLVVHLYRSFRNAYCASCMSELSALLRKFKGSVQKGQFDHAPSPPNVAGSQPPGATVPQNPASLYVLRALTDIVMEKLGWVTRSRAYDLYLILSWLYTVAVTSVTFAFEFLALQKVQPSSFGQAAQGVNLWGFLGYSLGNLTPVRISQVLPAGRIAVLLTYTEGASAYFILVILVFTVLTAARESYRREMEEFGTELRGVAGALDSRVTDVYRMTLTEVELFLLRDNAPLVNLVRKARGLPQLSQTPAPEVPGPPGPVEGGAAGSALRKPPGAATSNAEPAAREAV